MSLHVPEFKNVRIAVVGDVMVDHYWYGDTSRISPEAPVPVVHVKQTERRAGGAANVACNAARLGARTVLAGVVGRDEACEALLSELHAAQVQGALRQAEDFATISKTRIISRHQQLLRLDHESRVPCAEAGSLAAGAEPLVADNDLLILSDYGKGTLHHARELIRFAREHRTPVLVDPKGRDFERYEGATLLTPNQGEFEAVVGHCSGDTDLESKGRSLCEDLGLEAMLITRGEHGMSLLPVDGEPVHLRAEAREVFDVTGAGDTVIAALGCALAAGSSLQDAARIANLAAGLVVSKLGAATVSRGELLAGLRAAARIPSGTLELDRLLEAVDLARARGEQVVMTNGCFDLLHAGHVSYLEEARRLGDRLIVGLNSDESVARLKGPGRPLNPAAARAAVLGALRCVDWVVIFGDDTPAALIGQVLPDVLVKGGDYQAQEIAGAQTVLAHGGRVKVLGFVDGFSTSSNPVACRSRTKMIIVTGGAGFIGSNLAGALCQRQRTDVLVVDDLSDGTKFRNITDLDIADFQDMHAFRRRLEVEDGLAGVSAVFHQGACSDTTEWDGRYMMDVNYQYSKELFLACQRQGVPLIYASSAAVYGTGGSFAEHSRNEHPVNVYGYSKALFDRYVARHRVRGGAQVVGLRYFNVYGPRETHKGRMASVALHFHRQLSRGEALQLFEGCDGYGDGEQRRDFVHVDDVVAVNLWLLEHSHVSGVFNVGTGRSQSFNDVARSVIGWHASGQIRYIPFPTDLEGRYQSFTEADLCALREAGYDGSFRSVEEGVPAYLDALQRQEQGRSNQ